MKASHGLLQRRALNDANANMLECAENDGAQVGQERFLVLTTPDAYIANVKGIIKGNYDHNFPLGQIHVDEFHNTKSDTAPTPKLISDYKNEQSRIITDDPDDIKGKHESKEYISWENQNPVQRESVIRI